MQHPELLSYITQKMAAGAHEADIMDELLAAGWQRDEILKTYLHVVNTALLVKPPSVGTPQTLPHHARLQREARRIAAKRRKQIVLGLVTLLFVAGGGLYYKHTRPSLVSPSNVAAAQTETTAHVSQADVDVARLNNINPTTYLTTWNFSNLPAVQRSQYYKQSVLPDGTMKREYWITATVKTITLASGITYKAWAYDGQVPGPTLRATEGDTIVVHFTNDTGMDHTIDFGGYHVGMPDGSLPSQYVQPGASKTYTFTAAPAGLMLYESDSEPVIENINEGLYGTFIIDPKIDPRPASTQDFIMMMNAFDVTEPVGNAALLNGDGNNTVYALNTVAFWYQNHPIPVKVGPLYRIYLINITNFDQINSFHLHGNFFTVTPGGTIGSAQKYTDTEDIAEGDSEVLDVKFQAAGYWMFHSHKTEFTEKGWTGYFNATDGSSTSSGKPPADMSM